MTASPWSASENVHKRFGRHDVLKGVDLDVSHGRGAAA